MPVKLTDGTVVSVRDERAQRCFRLKIALDMYCAGCTPSAINGRIAHESGCPEAWKDAIFTCKECGCEFEPEGPESKFCSRGCRAVYHGDPDVGDD